MAQFPPNDYSDDLNYRCNKFNVGDKGQRYEVRYTDSKGIEKVFGWTKDPKGGAFVKSINLNPSMSNPRVIDREAEGKTTNASS